MSLCHAVDDYSFVVYEHGHYVILERAHHDLLDLCNLGLSTVVVLFLCITFVRF